MTRLPSRIVIVGGSLAGQRTVEELRDKGFDGTISIIEAADTLPGDRPPLSKGYLAGKLDRTDLQLLRASELASLEIDLHLDTRALRLDTRRKTVVLGDGTELGYNSLIVATGCSAWMPSEWAGFKGVHLLRTIDDAAALRTELDGAARVAVIGAGFIGSEVASTLTDLGLQVTLIDPLSAPLITALGDEPAGVVARLHAARGVDVRCGSSVVALEGDGRVERVRLSDGTVIETDVVVVGIGVRPNTAWLEGSDVSVENGVLCDAFLRTSAPDVYAIGDIARWFNPLYGEHMRREHWTNAGEHAAFVADQITGADGGDGFASLPFVWSDQLGLKIEMAGVRAPGDVFRLVDGDLDATSFVAEYVRDDRVVGALAFNAPRRLLQYRRTLPQSLARAAAH